MVARTVSAAVGAPATQIREALAAVISTERSRETVPIMAGFELFPPRAEAADGARRPLHGIRPRRGLPAVIGYVKTRFAVPDGRRPASGRPSPSPTRRTRAMRAAL